MEDFNLKKLNERIAQAQNKIETSAGKEKEAKVANLIVLLVKIEKELTTVNETLTKLRSHQLRNNPNSPLLSQIDEKLNTVERLTSRIVKARLNLNYHFV